jgi:hypothetical protein
MNRGSCAAKTKVRIMTEMPGHQLDCQTCKRHTPHNSPGVYINREGEKCRNMVCDFCGTITTVRLTEEKDEGQDKCDGEADAS